VPFHEDAGPLEDANHPIPRLDTVDTEVTTYRGAYVGLIISTPLRDDATSRARLHRKFELYLGYFQSPKYRERCGAPMPDRSKIFVDIHAGSDPSMLQLVEGYMAQVSQNGIDPILKLIHAH
jgi:hypothetical protein